MGDFKIGETNRIEFKRELNDKLEREVVAFLNYTEGGRIYIGVDDDGNAIGVDDLDTVQLKIVDRIKNNILPVSLGLFDIVTEKKNGVKVISIIISSGTEKPYYIKSQGMSPRGCYIRIGSSAQPMTTQMIDEMYAKRIRNSLDKIPAPRKDLTFEQLKIYYSENSFKLNDDTFKQSLEMLTEDGRNNYVAYLLADENGTSIKVAKYSGTNKVDLIQNEEYGYCSLIKSTKNVINKFEIENITKAKITGKERIEQKLVDKVALREAVVNAIVHNDYTKEIPPLFEIFSDRIVVTSHGGLVAGLSEEGFFSGYSMPRNRQLMRVFKDVGLVEQLGSGMARILAAYDKSIFEITPNFIRVTFKFRDTVPSGTVNGTVIDTVNEPQRKMLELLTANPQITTRDISAKLGISERSVKRNMKSLKDAGIIKRVGSDKTGYWEILQIPCKSSNLIQSE